MSEALALLSELACVGVSVAVEADYLVLDGNRTAIVARLPEIQRLKPGLLELLRPSDDAARYWRWCVVEADGREIECTVTPWHTLAEMRAAHPDALVLAPIGNAPPGAMEAAA